LWPAPPPLLLLLLLLLRDALDRWANAAAAE
jgi:hypothetical protein